MQIWFSFSALLITQQIMVSACSAPWAWFKAGQIVVSFFSMPIESFDPVGNLSYTFIIAGQRFVNTEAGSPSFNRGSGRWSTKRLSLAMRSTLIEGWKKCLCIAFPNENSERNSPPRVGKSRIFGQSPSTVKRSPPAFGSQGGTSLNFNLGNK